MYTKEMRREPKWFTTMKNQLNTKEDSNGGERDKRANKFSYQ